MAEEDDFYKAYNQHMEGQSMAEPEGTFVTPMPMPKDLSFVTGNESAVDLYGAGGEPAWVNTDVLNPITAPTIQEQDQSKYLEFLQLTEQKSNISDIITAVEDLPESFMKETSMMQAEQYPNAEIAEMPRGADMLFPSYLSKQEGLNFATGSKLSLAAADKISPEITDDLIAKAVEDAKKAGQDITEEMARTQASETAAQAAAKKGVEKGSSGLTAAQATNVANIAGIGGDIIHAGAMMTEKDSWRRDLAGYGAGTAQFGVGLGLALTGAGLPLALPLMASGIKNVFTYGAKDKAQAELAEREERERVKKLKSESSTRVQYAPGYIKQI